MRLLLATLLSLMIPTHPARLLTTACPQNCPRGHVLSTNCAQSEGCGEDQDAVEDSRAPLAIHVVLPVSSLRLQAHQARADNVNLAKSLTFAACDALCQLESRWYLAEQLAPSFCSPVALGRLRTPSLSRASLPRRPHRRRQPRTPAIARTDELATLAVQTLQLSHKPAWCCSRSQRRTARRSRWMWDSTWSWKT